MKRKSKLEPKMNRLPAKFMVKPHQKKRARNKDREDNTSQNKLDEKDTSQSELDWLPHDLKLDILTRLPAKSLASFRCVSKSWSSIIRSPEFVRSFYSVSSTRPRFVVALSNGIGNGKEEQLIFLFSYEEDPSSSSLVPNFDMALPCMRLSGLSGPNATSLHGFLALEVSGAFIICNPSTEQFVKLSSSTRYVGYDPIDDQHKALSMYSNQYAPVDTPVVHKVFTIGQDKGWRHVKPLSTGARYYIPTGMGVSINGFVYYAAQSLKPPTNQGIVCFHVRSEKLSYIKAPPDILGVTGESTFVDYKGKLASIVPLTEGACPYFQRFDLFILEDAEKHEWSRKICVIPLSVWNFVGGIRMSFPGTNMAGEIIMAPKILAHNVRPFYIFHYNVETRKIRRVRLQGIGDNQEFRRSYGLHHTECNVRMSPHHIESIAFFKNPTT